MELKLFGTPPPPPSEPEVTLRLIPEGKNVLLAAVDATGKPVKLGNLVLITPSGIDLMWSIEPALGFPLDDKGRLKITEE